VPDPASIHSVVQPHRECLWNPQELALKEHVPDSVSTVKRSKVEDKAIEFIKELDRRMLMRTVRHVIQANLLEVYNTPFVSFPVVPEPALPLEEEKKEDDKPVKIAKLW